MSRLYALRPSSSSVLVAVAPARLHTACMNALKRLTMKIIASLALVAGLVGCAAGAHAGPYTDTVDKQRHCAIEGEMGAEVYSRDTIFGKSLKEHGAAQTRGELTKDALEDIAVIFVTIRAAGLSTKKDAYMKAWAQCMDSWKRGP